MAKLTRKNLKVFGETATSTGTDPAIGQFGSGKAGTYVGTSDVETIQNLTAWSNGWIDAVASNQQFPTLPEMTGVHKVLSYQNAYILQQGKNIEWNASTTYYKGSDCCIIDGTTVTHYTSLTDDNLGNNPATDTTNWTKDDTNANGLPIGSVFPVMCTADYIPDGALPCNGAEYTKAQFNDLWTNYLTASTPLLLTCTYSEYASDISTYGECAKFAVDTTNNIFKVPTTKDGAYITQASSDTELGKAYNESLPNIKGTVIGPSGTSATGAFSVSPSYSLEGGGSAHIREGSMGFNASRSSSVYQDNASVQGNNVRLRYFVQVANGQLNQSQMDWSAWATSLQTKANINADNFSTTGKSTICSFGMPNYSAGITVSSSSLPYTVPKTGWLYLQVGTTDEYSYTFYLNGTKVIFDHHSGEHGHSRGSIVPCTSGDILTGSGSSIYWAVTFFPCKGVN